MQPISIFILSFSEQKKKKTQKRKNVHKLQLFSKKWIGTI